MDLCACPLLVFPTSSSACAKAGVNVMVSHSFHLQPTQEGFASHTSRKTESPHPQPPCGPKFWARPPTEQCALASTLLTQTPGFISITLACTLHSVHRAP